MLQRFQERLHPFCVFLLQFDTHFFETFRGKSILYPLTTPVWIYDMTLQPF